MKKLFFALMIWVYGIAPLNAMDEIERLKRRVAINMYMAIGWCSEEKALNFVDLILEAKPRTCVEIGVFGGASLIPTAFALKYLKEGIVIGIDPWDNSECVKHLDIIEDKEHVDWWSKIKFADVYHHLLDKLLLYDLDNYCIILKKTADQAIKDIESIDMLHIDGHRSEEMTLQDAKLYFPKVVPGGYIWVGDTLSFNKQKAVDFLLERCDVVKVIDNGNCVLFRKRL